MAFLDKRNILPIVLYYKNMSKKNGKATYPVGVGISWALASLILFQLTAFIGGGASFGERPWWTWLPNLAVFPAYAGYSISFSLLPNALSFYLGPVLAVFIGIAIGNGLFWL